jgi:bla regulator protein BlaR1
MDLFSSSDQWIEAFSKTLIHSLWSGLLLLFLLQVVLHAISHRRSHLRYLLTGMTMILYLGSVVALFAILYSPHTKGTGAIYGSAGLAYAMHRIAIGGTDTPVVLNSVWSLCYYLYITGIFLMILRFAYAVYHLQHIKSSGIPVGEQSIDFFIQLAGRMEISRKVRLLESDRITVPGLVGWIRPVVIVPAGMLTHLPLSQVETILMHELYHLKRYDFLVNVFQMVVEGLFFYNPAVWMISRTMRVEREHCCDDLVIAHCTTPLLYAKALYAMSNRNYSVKRWVPAVGGPDHPGLFNRITRILNYQAMKTDIRDKLFSLLIFFTCVAIFLVINGFSSGISILKTDGGEPSFSTGPAGNGPVIEVLAEPEPEILAEPEPRIIPEFRDTVPIAPEQGSGEVQKDVFTDQEIDEMIEEAQKAQKEAMEDIDWDKIKEEIEKAKKEALEDVDWEALKREMEQAKKEALEEIDWESVKKEIEESLNELKETDWQDMRLEIEKSIKDIDFESIAKDIENSVNDINWDELRKDLEQIRIDIEIMMQEMARDPTDS